MEIIRYTEKGIAANDLLNGYCIPMGSIPKSDIGFPFSSEQRMLD
jgi:hypothetical protein